MRSFGNQNSEVSHLAERSSFAIFVLALFNKYFGRNRISKTSEQFVLLTPLVGYRL